MDLKGVYDFLNLLGVLIRPLGALVFGVAMGWFAANKFTDSEKCWQLQIAIFLGLLGALVTMPLFAGAGSVGAFSIGVGIGVIILAVLKAQKSKSNNQTQK